MPVAPGDTVTFTITVFNQGTGAAYDIDVIDYIPTGLTLADADWTDNGTTATANIAGPMACVLTKHTQVNCAEIRRQVTKMRQLLQI